MIELKKENYHISFFESFNIRLFINIKVLNFEHMYGQKK